MNYMNELFLNRKFKALSDHNRQKILLYLTNGKKSAGDIAKQLSISAPSVSYHLSILRESQLIFSVSSKNFIYYELNPGALDDVIAWIAKFT